jgi:hypothetical protein
MPNAIGTHAEPFKASRTGNSSSSDRIRQHLRVSLKEDAISFLVAGEPKGELTIAMATELKELTDLDFLELNRWISGRDWSGTFLGEPGMGGS